MACLVPYLKFARRPCCQYSPDSILMSAGMLSMNIQTFMGMWAHLPLFISASLRLFTTSVHKLVVLKTCTYACFLWKISFRSPESDAFVRILCCLKQQSSGHALFNFLSIDFLRGMFVCFCRASGTGEPPIEVNYGRLHAKIERVAAVYTHYGWTIHLKLSLKNCNISNYMPP